jgi:molybdopterin/thiamine biosynthesis adenylyltransferase
MEYSLRLSGDQHRLLRDHLYPGDGDESVALALCGRRNGDQRHIFTVQDIVLIPHDECEERTPQRVIWPTRYVDPWLEKASKHQLAIMKIHSHPTGCESFSIVDDAADRSFLGSVQSVTECGRPHLSAVMLPDGRIFARTYEASETFNIVEMVCVSGDDILYWPIERDFTLPEFVLRHAQAFGEGTTKLLHRLKIVVVGCSGTGGPLISQLVRLGVGTIVLIDPDKVEEKNLNRIPFTTMSDAHQGRYKVDVIAKRVKDLGIGTIVIPIPEYLETPRAIKAAAECDMAFGCLDSWSGRDALNRLATYYSLPYIDIGVQLSAMPDGGIDQIMGAVHYLQPGKSSLKSRGVYDSEDVRAELVKRNDPEEYQKLLEEKYIRGVQEDKPAVISINTQMAAMAVNEFLARIHVFRYEPNIEFSAQWLALHEGNIFREPEYKFKACPILTKDHGRGDCTPLLNRPELSE